MWQIKSDSWRSRNVCSTISGEEYQILGNVDFGAVEKCLLFKSKVPHWLCLTFFTGMLLARPEDRLSQEKQPHPETHVGPQCSRPRCCGVSIIELDIEWLPLVVLLFAATWIPEDCAPGVLDAVDWTHGIQHRNICQHRARIPSIMIYRISTIKENNAPR